MSYTYGEQIYHTLLADIQNSYGVSALMGNLVAESNLNPKNLQNSYESSLGYTDETYTQAVDNGTYTKNQFVYDEAGYGLAQWTYWSRKQGMYEMKLSMGVSIGSVELACAFLLHELKTTYTGVYNSLKNATNIRTPSDVVLHDFENPADQSESVEIYRASLGTEIYNLYSGSVAPDIPDPDIPDNPDVPSVRRKRKKFNFLLFNRKRFNYYG